MANFNGLSKRGGFILVPCTPDKHFADLIPCNWIKQIILNIFYLLFLLIICNTNAILGDMRLFHSILEYNTPGLKYYKNHTLKTIFIFVIYRVTLTRR